MVLVHMVMFGFKPSASKEEVQKVCAEMLHLEKKCLHPTTQQPYMQSAMGGSNNSKEGFSGKSTHGFVMWFDSEKDRDYYTTEDPAHKAFVQLATPLIDDIRVVDFETGVFDKSIII